MMTTRPNDDDDALAAEYVIGVLSLDRRRIAETRLQRDSIFAELVTKWETYLAGLNGTYAPIAPPARVKACIDRSLFGTRKRRPSIWTWLAGMTTIAAVLAFLIWQPGSRDDADMHAILQGDDTFFALNIDTDAALIEVALQSPAPPRGSVFELWLLSETAPPLSLGVFASDTTLPLSTDLETGLTLAVSIEPLGGSPTGLPTGPVVATGDLSDA